MMNEGKLLDLPTSTVSVIMSSSLSKLYGNQ